MPDVTTSGTDSDDEPVGTVVLSPPEATPPPLKPISRVGDRVFSLLSHTAAITIVLLVLFTGVFLLALAAPSLASNNSNFLFSNDWTVGDPENLQFGILGLFTTTVISSLLAMLLAVPVAVGVALFLTQYAPKVIAGPIAFLIDLLAAVPSIVFGLWGIAVLAPVVGPILGGMSESLGFIPIFEPVLNSYGTVLIAGLVLSMMILPIVTAISRDVFAQTPTDHKEAALALGATKWEMIRVAVLPHGRSGVISASMLGLGRALGETIAVMLILSAPAPGSPVSISLFAGGETFASKIANNAAEFDSPERTGAYIAAGLVLFVITFAVNSVARIIAERGGAK